MSLLAVLLTLLHLYRPSVLENVSERLMRNEQKHESCKMPSSAFKFFSPNGLFQLASSHLLEQMQSTGKLQEMLKFHTCFLVEYSFGKKT